MTIKRVRVEGNTLVFEMDNSFLMNGKSESFLSAAFFPNDDPNVFMKNLTNAFSSLAALIERDYFDA